MRQPSRPCLFPELPPMYLQWTQPAACFTLVSLPGGEIGVLHERREHEHITFSRFTPDWPADCQ